MAQSIEETIGKNQADKLRYRLEETLSNDEGIIIIISKNKATDFYQGHCFEHTMEAVESTVSDYFDGFNIQCDK